MKMGRLVVVFVLLALTAGMASRVSAQGAAMQATADLKLADGTVVGTLTLTQEGDLIHFAGDLSNLPAGAHGIHVHAVGTCSPDFAAAGPHYNPVGKQHGLENPAGPHAGDLANVTVNGDGTAAYDHKTSMVSLLPGPVSVYDADGSSIIIHTSADDYKTDPSGNSGGRIACGVINAAQATAPSQESPPAPAPEPAPAPVPVTLPDTGVSSPMLLLLLVAVTVLASGFLISRRFSR